MNTKTCLYPSAAAISLLMSAEIAGAKGFEVCNGQPFPTYMSVGFQKGSLMQTRGHYLLEAGSCTAFDGVEGKSAFVRAVSSGEVAKFINDGASVVYDGWKYLCHNHQEAFHHYTQSNCDTRAGYKEVRLSNSQFSRITIKEKNHEHLTTETAPAAEQSLAGRMQYEHLLRTTPGREAAFQFGIQMEDTEGGVRVKFVYSGMPADEEGMRVGDYILSIDGVSLTTAAEVSQRLDAVSIYRNSPMAIEISRNGETIRGVFAPLFYPFNHHDYKEENAVGAFAWEFADGAMLGFGNEIACGGGTLIAEGLSWAFGEGDFELGSTVHSASKCSESANREQEKFQILYSDAANAGFWASFLAPGIPAAKVFKAGKAVKLANRSRHVAPSQYGKGTLK